MSYDRERYLANREAVLARQKVYNAAHAAERYAYKQNWNAANPDKVKGYGDKSQRLHRAEKIVDTQRYRAMKVAATLGDIPKDIMARLIDFYGEACMADGCNNTTKLTLDHVIPLSKGGSHSIRNFQVLCGACNSGKRNTNSNDYRNMQTGILVGVMYGQNMILSTPKGGVWVE